MSLVPLALSERAPVDVNAIVEPESIVTAPVIFASSIPSLFITIPFVPASNSIAIAFTSTFVDESLPTVIVLAEAPEPMLIAPVWPRSPKLIDPLEELKDIFPVEFNSNVVAPDNVVAPVPPNTNDAVPSVNVKASVDAKLISVPASISTPPADAAKWIAFAAVPCAFFISNFSFDAVEEAVIWR